MIVKLPHRVGGWGDAIRYSLKMARRAGGLGPCLRRWLPEITAGEPDSILRTRKI